MGCLV